jgi:hypothetical protein
LSYSVVKQGGTRTLNRSIGRHAKQLLLQHIINQGPIILWGFFETRNKALTAFTHHASFRKIFVPHFRRDNIFNERFFDSTKVADKCAAKLRSDLFFLIHQGFAVKSLMLSQTSFAFIFFSVQLRK